MAIQAKDILGKWKVEGLAVADKTIPVKASCFYAFDFGGNLTYTIEDDALPIEINEVGTWSFEIDNAQLVMQFRTADGQTPPEQRFVCQVLQAASPTLKFTYADVNGILSGVSLAAAP